MVRQLLSLAALAASAGAGTADAAQTAACVTPAEAESITLVAIPEMITEVGRVCATTLPPNALVRQTSGPMIARYRAEADRAWPAARTALGRVAGPNIAPLLQSDFTRPLLTSLLAPALVGQVQPADCAAIEHIVTLVQPLPPRNVAGLVVSTVQFIRQKQAEQPSAGQVLDLPICTETRR